MNFFDFLDHPGGVADIDFDLFLDKHILILLDCFIKQWKYFYVPDIALETGLDIGSNILDTFDQSVKRFDHVFLCSILAMF